MSEENTQEKLRRELLWLEQELTEDKLPEDQKHVIKRLLEASYAERAIMEQTLRELANHPEESLAGIIHVIQNRYKLCWEIAFHFLHEMGYPRNAPALAELIQLVAEPYAFPGYDEALQVLQSVQPRDLAPYLIQALWDRGQENRYWSSLVGGICTTIRELGYDYALLCGPVVAYLLSQKDKLDHSSMLAPLELLSPHEKGYVLPVLIDLFSKEGVPQTTRDQARKLILSFPQETLQPYAQILPPLQKDVEDMGA